MLRSLSCPTQETTRATRSFSVATSTTSATEIEDIQTRYYDHIIHPLEQVKEKVMALESVQFRIEILENLFSLLFLRAEDVLDQNEQSDSGEEGFELSLSVNIPDTGPDTPLCQTPGTPNSPPFWLSPLREKSSSVLETLLEEKQKINRSLFSDDRRMNKENEVETKCVTKTERMTSFDLKPLDLTEKEKGPLHDPQLSSNSYTSSCSLKDKYGFLCNEYFMRDAVLLLQKCLKDTEPQTHLPSSNTKGYNVKIQAPGEEQSVSDKHAKKVPTSMKCSISEKECKTRTITLTQHISEALWCFQLVSHDFIPFHYGKIVGNPRLLESMDSDDEIGKLDFPVTRKKNSMFLVYYMRSYSRELKVASVPGYLISLLRKIFKMMIIIMNFILFMTLCAHSWMIHSVFQRTLQKP